MLDELYTPKILHLAAHIGRIGRLVDAHVSSSKRAKYCGSIITVDLRMKAGIISDFAQEIQACALGQASAAIVAEQIIGSSFDELKALRKQVVAMLEKDGEPPDGRFAQFALLQPVKDYKARHGAVLLVLDAVVDCFDCIAPHLLYDESTHNEQKNDKKFTKNNNERCF